MPLDAHGDIGDGWGRWRRVEIENRLGVIVPPQLITYTVHFIISPLPCSYLLHLKPAVKAPVSGGEINEIKCNFIFVLFMAHNSLFVNVT